MSVTVEARSELAALRSKNEGLVKQCTTLRVQRRFRLTYSSRVGHTSRAIHYPATLAATPQESSPPILHLLCSSLDRLIEPVDTSLEIIETNWMRDHI
jgi:hypothetical protein